MLRTTHWGTLHSKNQILRTTIIVYIHYTTHIFKPELFYHNCILQRNTSLLFFPQDHPKNQAEVVCKETQPLIRGSFACKYEGKNKLP